MTSWGVAEAKARFSAVLDKAEAEGPQMVTRRKKSFVLLTAEAWAATTPAVSSTADDTAGETFLSGLRPPPEERVDFEFARIKWQPRKLGL